MECTSVPGRFGHDIREDEMNPRLMDLKREGSARAHSDGVRVPKKEALRMHVAPRTARRWNHEGPPQLTQLAVYMDGHPSPHRIAAHVMALAEDDVARMTKDELIMEYRRIIVGECELEAADRRALVEQCPWLDIAAQAERNAASDARKAAIARQFELRGIPWTVAHHG
ncbi:hypothetical protein [Gaopeijia maritima]|uniref:hypothetical protein n=1 Tax=Gaopeijia maritima TaxID=3119007 RepID=UPI00326E2FE1